VTGLEQRKQAGRIAMIINGFLFVFLVGCLGGLLGEAIKWFQLRESANLPAYVRSPFYWFITFLMIVLGGLLATLYGIDNRNAILIANIGLSAPLIIKALAETNPVSSGRSHLTNLQVPSLVNFLAGR